MPLSVEFLNNSLRCLAAANESADYRRCVSTAYYAAWHAVCESASEKFHEQLRPDLCRCPEHLKVKTSAGHLRSRKSKWLPNHELSDKMDTFCTRFIQLQEDRHLADYSIIRPFNKVDAERAYGYAESVIYLIGELSGSVEYDTFILDCLGIKPTHR